MPLVDLLQREPATLLHQVDEAEVAGAHHDDVPIGDVVLGLLLLLLLRRRAGRLGDGEPDHGVLLVTAFDPGDVAARKRALDELVEAVPVPLLEGRTLGLPVVGEDDDLVRSRSVVTCALDLAEVVVELAQRFEGVRTLEARVVRDLVVARECRVDRGSSTHDVGENSRDDQVAHEHAERPSHQRVDAATVAARADVAANCPQRLLSTRG